MRLTTKLSAFMTLLTGLAMLVTLIGSSLSFYNATHEKVNQRVLAVATIIDNELVSSSPETLRARLNEVLVPIDITEFSLRMGDTVVYEHDIQQVWQPAGNHYGYRSLTVELMKHPGMFLSLTYRDPMANYYRSLLSTVPVTAAIGLMIIVLFFAIRWMKRQLAGQELLKNAPHAFLTGNVVSMFAVLCMSGQPGPVARLTCCCRIYKAQMSSAAGWIRLSARLLLRMQKRD